MPPSANLLQPPATYHSYLVRLWQDHSQGPWRASAHCIQTGETVRFASVEALLAYLLDQSAGAAPDASAHAAAPPSPPGR